MAFRFVFLPDAEKDIAEAINWYERIQSFLSQDFILRLDDTLFTIQSHPEHFQKTYRQYRKLNLTRFPYKVIYKVEKDVIIIVAVVHHKRRPKYWMRRK